MSFITPPSYPGFSTAAYTTAPNNAVNVAAVQAVGGTASVDLALVPKGTGGGSLLADVPDNGTGGGNKRGAAAVDLQMLRGAADQIAGGQLSVICGGSSNKTIAIYGVVVGGSGNTANGSSSTIVGGGGNTAGASSIDSGNTVGGGSGNYANGLYATIPGGQGAWTRGTYGRLSFGSFNLVNQSGQWQFSKTTEAGITTTAAATNLCSNQAAGGVRGTDNVQIVGNNSANYFETIVVARDNATGDSSAWRITGLIKRGAGVGTTAIVGAPVTTLIAQDAGAAAWAVAVSADTTLGALQVTVTGAAGSTIRWNAHTELTEVGF